ncbi:MAG: hypothetical protein P4L72_03355 [Parvibaculum sp.]|uniref:hypothetical protein n=1 Tax=Parvibaculum sp. TaxID=2024848 RepID=UPI00283C5D40|nr:hypothetical protein [Parvibaculum sp.]MDR3498246.1 hypothetical protein [Parvibaculum sp.]
MTRPFAFTVTLLSALAAGTSAMAKDVGSGLIGNTVELTGPAGTTSIYYPNHKILVVRAPNGKTTKGWWRVKGRSICTKIGDKDENCTDPIKEPPVAGSSGVITGDQGDLKWTVKKGKGF